MKTEINGNDIYEIIEKTKAGSVKEGSSKFSDYQDYLVFCGNEIYRSNGDCRVVYKNGFSFNDCFFGIPVKWLKSHLGKSKKEREKQYFYINLGNGTVNYFQDFQSLEFETGIAIHQEPEPDLYFGLSQRDFINLVNQMEPEQREKAIDHVTKYNPGSSYCQKEDQRNGNKLLLESAQKAGLIPEDYKVCEICGNPGRCEYQLFRNWNPNIRTLRVPRKRQTKPGITEYKKVRVRGAYDETEKIACTKCREHEIERQANMGNWNPEKMNYDKEK